MGRSSSSTAGVNTASASRAGKPWLDLSCCAPDAIQLCGPDDNAGASQGSQSTPLQRTLQHDQRSQQVLRPPSRAPAKLFSTPASDLALSAARGLATAKMVECPGEACPIHTPKQAGTPALSTEKQSLPQEESQETRREMEEKAIRRMREERRLTALRFLRCGQARIPNDRSTKLVVKLMYKYYDTAEIQSSGALVLASIAAHSPENRPLVVLQGGIEVLADALRHHTTDLEVVRACCRALISLTDVSAEYRTRAIAAGAESVLTEAAEIFSGDPDLAGITSYALRCIGAREFAPQASSTPPASPVSLS